MTDNSEIRIRDTDMPGDEELHLLQRRLENHIGRFDEHVAQQDKRWDQLMQSQEDTNQSIKELVVCTTELHASTKDVVEAWNTGTSVVKFVPVYRYHPSYSSIGYTSSRYSLTDRE